jgi:chemotaxis protein methyltransferase CheR
MEPIKTEQASGSDYEPFCTAVQRICGIDLSQYKRGQMERRIRSFVQLQGHDADLREYAKVLAADSEQLDAFLNRVTINVSQLWRNPELWETLEKKILPELLETGRGRIRCWSAGSSYGAEAYTLAAIATKAVPSANVSITGTDIDARMVEKARSGVFTVADTRDAPTATLAAHFTQEGDRWVAAEALKRLVRFEQGDLLRKQVAPESYDLVLCRNTVIYFNEEVRDALHGRLATSLRPGGYLVVGNTERVADPAGHGLSASVPFIYRKD